MSQTFDRRPQNNSAKRCFWMIRASDLYAESLICQAFGWGSRCPITWASSEFHHMAQLQKSYQFCPVSQIETGSYVTTGKFVLDFKCNWSVCYNFSKCYYCFCWNLSWACSRDGWKTNLTITTRNINPQLREPGHRWCEKPLLETPKGSCQPAEDIYYHSLIPLGQSEHLVSARPLCERD